MGAYENPPIITPPDYGEIFIRNFNTAVAQAEAAKQRAEARREKIKAEQQRLDDKILAFDLQRTSIKAGDLTQSLQQQTTFLADDFAENERLYSEGRISREKYNSNRLSAFRKLNEMKNIGAILTQQSKEFDDANINQSLYQGEAVGGLGLLNAWKQGKIKFSYVGDEIEMYYGDKAIPVDMETLQSGKFFNINEKIQITNERLKDIGGGRMLKKEAVIGDTFVDKDGIKKNRKQDKYSLSQENNVFIENKIKEYMNNSQMNDLFKNEQDRGSIFMDDVLQKIAVKDKEGNYKLTKEGVNFIEKTFDDPDQIKLAKAAVESGEYNENNAVLLDQISRRDIAQRAFNIVDPGLQVAITPATVGSPGKPTKQEIESNELKNLLGVVSEKNMTGIDLYNMINANNQFKSNFGFGTGQQLVNTGTREDVEVGIKELISNSKTKADGQRLKKELENLPKGNFIFDMEDLALGKLTKLNEIDIYAKIIEESPAFSSLSVKEIRELLNNAGLRKSIKDGEDFSISAEEVEKSKKSLDPDFKKKLEDKAAREKILSN